MARDLPWLQVWMSSDGGNSFDHIYKFGIYGDDEDSVSEVIPGWHYNNGLVAVLSRTKLIVAKTGRVQDVVCF